MKTTIILFLLSVPVWAALAYVVFLLIKALRKYIRSEPLRLGTGGTGQNIGRDIEAPSDGVQNDAGVCGGGAGCQPAGGIQVGKPDSRIPARPICWRWRSSLA